MSSANHQALWRAVAYATFIVAILVCLKWYYGLHWNLSNSVNGVIWFKQDYAKPGKINNYVFICPPASFINHFDLAKHVNKKGACGGIVSLLKRIIAVQGDLIKIDSRGIYVNNKLIDNSQPMKNDGLGNALPKQQLNQIIPKGYIGVIGDTPTSFDSRYFGLVKEEWVMGIAKRLF